LGTLSVIDMVVCPLRDFVASVASEGSSGVSEVDIAILPDSCGGFVFEGLCDIPEVNVSSLVMTRDYVACVYQVIANECQQKEFMSCRARDDWNVISEMGVLPPVESFNSVFPNQDLESHAHKLCG
jgi:hypothetical protein